LRILFLGCLFDQQEENNLLKKSKIGLSGAVNTYQWNLINGLDKILKRPVDIINVLSVGTYPKYFRDIILRTKRWSHSPGAHDLEIGSPNLPLLKQVIRTILCKNAVKRWIKNAGDNNRIIVYSTYLPYLLAVKKLPINIKITLIVTDLPEYYDLTDSSNTKMKSIRAIYNRLIYASLKRIDSFVILTEQMKVPLNIGERPYVVIEGLVDDEHNTRCTEVLESTEKVLLYTGTLNYRFGIGNLLEAFKCIDKKDYKLWICGSGEAAEEIVSVSKADNRVKYFGYVTKNEIYKLQKQATLLINPRANDGEYTKYSFPSKTMEYMLSGKPVLMYKLDGIPDEYDQYLYYINGSEPKDIADRIMEICEQPQSELDDFGQKARKFVLENKNSEVQAKKIIDMIEMINKQKRIMI
jgi:glycosyltransferase involved in cell wall biosynthesis